MKQLVLSFPNTFELTEYLMKNEITNIEVHHKNCILIGFFTNDQLDIAIKLHGAEIKGTMIEININNVFPRSS